ncbi:hypothetical protein LEP1GSC127_0068 [Leptospira kirschneri str. 200801925]|nr:hypothetical protein LEP1GSC127_0068 [Leptospira kirschneri str. 200801925]
MSAIKPRSIFKNTLFILGISGLLFLLLSCFTTKNTDNESIKHESIPNPAGENEVVLNEEGQEVILNTGDPAPFLKPSKDPLEYFRVHISSDGYQLRQLRGSKFIKRKVDKGGDALISEELARFNKSIYRRWNYHRSIKRKYGSIRNDSF